MSDMYESYDAIRHCACGTELPAGTAPGSPHETKCTACLLDALDRLQTALNRLRFANGG